MTQHHPDAYYAVPRGDTTLDVFDAVKGGPWASFGTSDKIKSWNISGNILVIYYESTQHVGDVFDLHTRSIIRGA